MFSPPGGISGLETNQFIGVFGSIALYPPSPPFTLIQLKLVVAELVAGEPLSCVPPTSVFESVGCWEKLTNWVIDPRFWFRSSNRLLPEHEPVVSPE